MYSQRKNCKFKEIQWELTEKILFQEIFASYESAMTTEKGLGHFFTALKASETQKEFHHCLTTLKGTVMQIEKALTNDRLPVSKVS